MKQGKESRKTWGRMFREQGNTISTGCRIQPHLASCRKSRKANAAGAQWGASARKWDPRSSQGPNPAGPWGHNLRSGFYFEHREKSLVYPAQVTWPDVHSVTHYNCSDGVTAWMQKGVRCCCRDPGRRWRWLGMRWLKGRWREAVRCRVHLMSDPIAVQSLSHAPYVWEFFVTWILVLCLLYICWKYLLIHSLSFNCFHFLCLIF